ncbi:hypothetical protein FOA43_000232 [Brettanomyces nanus]|uniref:Uncharacterized protein n=1 Tax=Eeniella nana TaxID=13502 RepID=A0A875RWP4_EENNA|nr:uncharacterized protein FOA43_000232 [Brettanomyces nanus]QPG72928.1 hypothetical protein FOA43_000232 [Brettanomyces nanus]
MPSSKNRAALIISKLNRRYKHCLDDLLNYYGKVATQENEIEKIRVKEIDFEQITIGFHHKMVDFEILKPLRYEDDRVCKNWNEVESTIQKMCYTAANAKNVSPICLKKIVYPFSPINWLLIFGMSLLFIGHYNPDFIYNRLLGRISLIPPFKPWNDTILLGAMITHVTESLTLLRPKMAYYRIPVDYKMEWYACSMLDGFASVNRLNNYVKSIEGRYFDFSDDSESIDVKPVVDSDSELQ